MRNCNICGKPAVLIAGHGYCEKHLYIYEKPLIEAMIGVDDSKLLKKFFLYAFETTKVKFSMFNKLYEKFPQIKRGNWLGHQLGFTKPQGVYLSECWEAWQKTSYGRENEEVVIEKAVEELRGSE